MISFVVVDDSVIFREKIINIIKSYNNTKIVGEFDNADDAINLLDNLNPDVALIDIKLTSGNGIDILRAIKRKALKTKVVMITNYPYLEYQLECVKLGSDYFFDKSKELDKLFITIENITSMAENQVELQL